MENNTSKLTQYYHQFSSFNLEKLPLELFHAEFTETKVSMSSPPLQHVLPHYRIIQSLPEIHFLPTTRHIDFI